MIEKGVLYIVSTPIGNLEDITFRAIRILKDSSLIAAEDTRRSKVLLSHYNISTPTISYYEHNRYTRIPKLIDHLIDGENIALITDAGTPGISDPAYRLIRAAINSDCRVESIPGASASLAALVASGLPTDRFIFEGFLPHKKGRKGKLEKVKDIDATIIFYESPNRLVRTLNDILEYIGDRPIAIGRELSKKFEEIMRGRVSDILSHYNTNKPKGEFVIVIGKDDPNVYF
ncbi:MAG: 16S rRNA (cytidine(1402)-2'-O)-methyltransferase [Candidatus Marinimicrobia bacterium]|nr:16S rRNA (cytidine(1402)-2'-O)-methyltransferase [Candidatus Neomarinimicrobiota bacterium]|tara:strand:+ start:2899 stop:3591 length:693 start_codon:yes stop_codon:yes gene_type:complete